MGAKGEATRQNIIRVARTMVLNRGFGGTSIDEIIREARITKGGFFYHFSGKTDLARHLMLDYLEEDDAFFDRIVTRARELVEEPLQQALLFLKLVAEEMEMLGDTHPGCLVASYTYEAQLFNEEVKALTAEGLLRWRAMFTRHFMLVLEKHPPALDVSMDDLADMLTGVIEGGIILSRALDDRSLLPKQILQFRNYVRLLFAAPQ